MSRDVFIDGKRFDVPEESPGIEINNPAFIDVGDIKANRTEQFNVLPTQNNKNNIELINEHNVTGTYQRKNHVLSEYKNGISIIYRAIAKLLTVNRNGFVFSVSWGSLVDFSDELKFNLIELPSLGFIEWSDSSVFMRTTQTYGFLSYLGYDPILGNESDGNGAAYIRRVHPSIRVDYLFEYIFKSIDVKVNWSGDALSRINTYYIPLLTKNVPDEGFESVGTRLSIIGFSGGSRFYGDYMLFSAVTDNLNIFLNERRLKVKNGQTYSFRFNYTLEGVTVDLSNYNIEFSFRYFVRPAKGGDYYTTSEFFTVPSTGNIFTIKEKYSLTINSQIDEPELFCYAFLVHKQTGNAIRLQTVDSGYNCTGSGEVYVYLDDSVSFGGYFPLIENLPNMSCLDFVKNILFIGGLSVSSSIVDRSINVYPTDDILNTFDSSNDYSGNELESSENEYSFVFKNYAQRNYFKYSSDEFVDINADGEIIINDETLIKDNTVIELKFAPSENKTVENLSGRAVIQLYVRGEDDGAFVFNGDKLTPRIIKAVQYDDEGIMAGSFDSELYFDNIIGNRYLMLSNVLTDTKILSYSRYVKDIDILNIDTGKVVYLKGSYWIIIDTVVKDNIQTVNLARIKRIL